MKAGLTPRGMCCVKRAIGRAGKSQFPKNGSTEPSWIRRTLSVLRPIRTNDQRPDPPKLSCARKSTQTSQSNPRRYRPHRDSPVGLSDMARYAACPAIQRGSFQILAGSATLQCLCRRLETKRCRIARTNTRAFIETYTFSSRGAPKSHCKSNKNQAGGCRARARPRAAPAVKYIPRFLGYVHQQRCPPLRYHSASGAVSRLLSKHVTIVRWGYRTCPDIGASTRGTGSGTRCRFPSPSG